MHHLLRAAYMLLFFSVFILAQKGGNGQNHGGSPPKLPNQGQRPGQNNQGPRPGQGQSPRPGQNNPPKNQNPRPGQNNPPNRPPNNWGGNNGGNRPGNNNNNGGNRPGNNNNWPGNNNNWPGNNNNWPGNNNNDHRPGNNNDHRPGNNNNGRPWNNGGRDGGWRRPPQRTTTVHGGGWRGGNDWHPVRTVTSYVPRPTWDIPYYPVITLDGPIIPLPRPGCSQVPTTQHTSTITEATFTSTITEAPDDGVITVYVGDDGQSSTYGLTTYYEVYVYETTQSVDIIGSGVQCGISWGKRTAAPVPAAAIAYATPAPTAA